MFQFQWRSEQSFGITKGSIFGPLLFIMYICDLFMEYDTIEFASYVDDPILLLMEKNLMK